MGKHDGKEAGFWGFAFALVSRAQSGDEAGGAACLISLFFLQ